ncbi:Uncharacterised protein g7636 [Pycnogonum litorale]
MIGWYEDQRTIDYVIGKVNPTETIVRAHAEMLFGNRYKDTDIGDYFTMKEAFYKNVDIIRRQCSRCYKQSGAAATPHQDISHVVCSRLVHPSPPARWILYTG